MATVMIDDRIYARLRARAEASGRTIDEEGQQLIDEGLTRSRTDWAASLRALRETIRAEHGAFPDSVGVIRQMRDEE